MDVFINRATSIEGHWCKPAEVRKFDDDPTVQLHASTVQAGPDPVEVTVVLGYSDVLRAARALGIAEAPDAPTPAADDKWKEQVMSLTGSLVEADKELRRRIIVLESRVRGLEDPGSAPAIKARMEAQREALAESGPWEPMFKGAAESAAARIFDETVLSVDDAPKPVEFVGAAELYRKALQDIADGARDPVSVAWKALHDASWSAFQRKANEPLRPNTVTTPDPATSWTINEGGAS